MDLKKTYPKSWHAAFRYLEDHLIFAKEKEKIVLFFDEFPWFDTKKSSFLSEFSYFWNSFCEKRKNLIVIVSGPDVSYIINKILRNKGSLYNRHNLQTYLEPFDLIDSSKILKENDTKQILNIYSVFGGIPLYLENIDYNLVFNANTKKFGIEKNSLLQDEFDELYKALYQKSKTHRKIIELLVSSWSGFTQNQILKSLNVVSSIRRVWIH